MEYDKKFIIIGNINAISYRECFEAIKENRMWLGYNCVRHFAQPDGTMYETARTYWYTNLDIAKRHEDIILYKTYQGNEVNYPHYDNYDAINVDRTQDIPVDYAGIIGVPITYLDKYNADQFEILGMSASAGYSQEIVGIPFIGDRDARPLVNGKNIYARVFIKNKRL